MKKQITAAALSAVMTLGMAAAPAQGIIPAVQPVITASAEETLSETDVFISIYYYDNSNTKHELNSGFVAAYDGYGPFVFDANNVAVNAKDIKTIVFEMSIPSLPDNKQAAFLAKNIVQFNDTNAEGGSSGGFDEFVNVKITPDDKVYYAWYSDRFKSTDKFNSFDFETMVGSLEVTDYTPANPAPVDPAPAKKSLSNATVKTSNKTYTGKALTPAVTVTLDGKTLKKGTDYTAAYKNNKKCGKATVTVTGKGGYEGSKSAIFIIKPKKAAVKKLASPKKGQVKLTWKKSAGGVTGYEVQMGMNKKFSKASKIYTIKKASTTHKTFKKLKSGKKYFARVRAYKTVAKTKYFGAWSGIKSVKCK